MAELRRVVITGIGIVSSIGNNQQQVLESLKQGKSGIVHCDEYADMGFRSHVHGAIDLDIGDHIDKKDLRFMGDGAAYNYIAMQQAIADSGLEQKDISNDMTGLIVGSGGPSTRNLLEAFDKTRNSSPKRVGPFMVPRTMCSTNSATIATPFGIKGVNYTISSACSTSSHCIGNGTEMIQMGKQDIVFAGGGEELHWTLTVLFDAMGALSSRYNDTPHCASRAYDRDRDGFVIAGGGAVVVLEALDHALARGAQIYGEVTGYGLSSDGYDMVQPSGEGAKRCMKMAMKTMPDKPQYINAHGTSTPIGDVREIEAITQLFHDELKQDIPYISSTKSLTGHSLGATGAQEAIYSLLMMRHRFICASAHIDHCDDMAANVPIVQNIIEDYDLNHVISNSFGFGGTNCTLGLSRYQD